MEDCVIAAFLGQGVDIVADGAQIAIARSTLYGHGNRGVSASGALTLAIEQMLVHDVHGPGVHVESGAIASIAHSRLEANRRGVTVFGNRAGFETHVAVTDTMIGDSELSGLWVRSLAAGGAAFAHVMRARIVASGNEGVRTDAVSGATGIASVERSTISGNTTGIVNGGSAGATIVVSGSTIAANAGFGLQHAGGTLLSRGNNTVHDNNGGGAQTSGTISPLGAM
jgi:hypothetical protein